MHQTVYNNRSFDLEALRMRFCEYVNTRKPYEVSDLIERDINYLGSLLLQHNHEFLVLVSVNGLCVREILRKRHI